MESFLIISASILSSRRDWMRCYLQSSQELFHLESFL
jgi:hypothetical protein